MSKIYTIPLHIGDWLGGTAHMSAIEIGCYIRLIVAHYNLGEEGLPNNDKYLARICGVSSHQWGFVKQTLISKFEVTDTHLRQLKVVNVIKNVNDISAKQSAKSLKMWDIRYATAKQQLSNGYASLKPKALNHIDNRQSSDIFKHPTIEEISTYCRERKNRIDPKRFFDHYESNGWKVGRVSMKDWKAAIRNWEKNTVEKQNEQAIPYA